MDTNNINSNEFEQMRSQLEIMKRKLDQQEIVSDRLMQQAMQQKVSWIKKYIWFELTVLYPFIAVSFALFTAVFDLSWLIYAAIVILVGADIYFDFVINKTGPADWLNENLVETSRKLVRMKRLRMWQLIISLPLFFAVMFLFFYDMSRHSAPDLFTGICTGGIIGGIIGLCIGIWIVVKMQRTNDELIRQIEEITKEKHSDAAE